MQQIQTFSISDELATLVEKGSSESEELKNKIKNEFEELDVSLFLSPYYRSDGGTVSKITFTENDIQFHSLFNGTIAAYFKIDFFQACSYKSSEGNDKMLLHFEFNVDKKMVTLKGYQQPEREPDEI